MTTYFQTQILRLFAAYDQIPSEATLEIYEEKLKKFPLEQVEGAVDYLIEHFASLYPPRIAHLLQVLEKRTERDALKAWREVYEYLLGGGEKAFQGNSRAKEIIEDLGGFYRLAQLGDYELTRVRAVFLKFWRDY